jgi:murein DD-endopeptidase MepM/ murein hydrolase activator NlpD
MPMRGITFRESSLAVAGFVCSMALSISVAIAYPNSPIIFPLNPWTVNCNGYWGTCNIASQRHLGEDVPASAGTQVLAPVSGWVKEAQFHNGYGGTVLIESTIDNELVVFVIGHMNTATLLVNQGQWVDNGAAIGYVGTSSQNGGWTPHVHLAVRRGAYNATGTACGEWQYHGYSSCESEFTQWYIPTHYVNCHPNGDRVGDGSTSWSFATSRNCWYLGGGAIDAAFAAPGAWIVGVRTDPQLISPPLNIQASNHKRVRFSMASLATNSTGQVFFTTTASPVFSEDKSQFFTVVPGGAYHSYTVDFSANSAWSGTITKLRIDPVSGGTPNGTIGLQSVNVDPSSSSFPAPFNSIAPVNGATAQPTSITLSWGSSFGADTYEYCYDTTNNNICDGNWLSRSTTSVSISGLAGATTYYWQVRARNAAGTTDANGGAWWSFRTVDLPPAFAKIGPANGLTGQPTALTLSWQTASTADSYEYCYDTTNNNTCDGNWLAEPTTSVLISGLAGATNHYWQVRARNMAGTTDANGGAWWSFRTVDLPPAFGKIAPTNGLTEQPTSRTLSWQTAITADSYEYCYDTINNNICDGNWLSRPTPSVLISGLTAATTYYWQVRARNATGTTDADSGAWWSFRTMELPPAFGKIAPTTGVAGQPTSLTLSWQTASAAESYEYCYDTINNNICDGNWLSRPTTDAFISGLIGSTTYFWQVRARNGAGTTEANVGAWWNFSTQAESTRIITLSGSLDFGAVLTGTTATRTLTISNSGNSTLTVSSTTYPTGFSGNWTSGVVPAGGSQDVIVSFSPNTSTSYGGAVVVNSDHTSGIATTTASGIGIAAAAADFDGDGKSDIAVYRRSSGRWFILHSSTNSTTWSMFQWGISEDIPVPGDYDGDAKTDMAVYRPSNGVWYVLESSTKFTTWSMAQWGIDEDIPAPGDYDGDGKIDLAVYRPSDGTWHVLKSSTNFTTWNSSQWGVSGDIPVPGDYDGDGKTDVAVYRPSNGVWYVLESRTNFSTWRMSQWGVGGDIPMPGDYDGDGKIDLTAYRPSTGTWFILKSSTNSTTSSAHQWGIPGDILASGDYDGDGRTDIAVYRPSNGVWYVLKSSTSFTTWSEHQWGIPGDTPVFERR